MAEAPFFHVGILVPDLGEAITRFSEALGLDFARPMRTVIPQLEQNGVTTEFEVYVSYSRQGPPHLELIEAAGDGVYGPARGYGLHHLGTWVEDADDYLTQLNSRGIRTEATFHDGAINLGAYFNPSDLFGVRMEACPILIRPGWRDWITSGEAASDSFI